jgi:hypothetical protein
MIIKMANTTFTHKFEAPEISAAAILLAEAAAKLADALLDQRLLTAVNVMAKALGTELIVKAPAPEMSPSPQPPLTPPAPLNLAQPTAPAIQPMIPETNAAASSYIAPGPTTLPPVTVPPVVAPVAPAPTVQVQNYTLGQLQQAMAPLMDAGKMPELGALMARYNTDALTKINPQYYPDIAADLRAMGGQI